VAGDGADWTLIPAAPYPATTEREVLVYEQRVPTKPELGPLVAEARRLRAELGRVDGEVEVMSEQIAGLFEG